MSVNSLTSIGIVIGSPELGEPSLIPMIVRNVARVVAQQGSAEITAQRGSALISMGSVKEGTDNIDASVDREKLPE